MTLRAPFTPLQPRSSPLPSLPPPHPSPFPPFHLAWKFRSAWKHVIAGSKQHEVRRFFNLLWLLRVTHIPMRVVLLGSLAPTATFYKCTVILISHPPHPRGQFWARDHSNWVRVRWPELSRMASHRNTSSFSLHGDCHKSQPPFPLIHQFGQLGQVAKLSFVVGYCMGMVAYLADYGPTSVISSLC